VLQFSSGRERIRFKTVRVAKTHSYMHELIEKCYQCRDERRVHSLIAVAAFNLDFLCIHPFRDENGRKIKGAA